MFRILRAIFFLNFLRQSFKFFPQIIILDLPVATLKYPVSINSILKHFLLSQKKILVPLSKGFVDQSHLFLTCGSLKNSLNILTRLISV